MNINVFLGDYMRHRNHRCTKFRVAPPFFLDVFLDILLLYATFSVVS